MIAPHETERPSFDAITEELRRRGAAVQLDGSRSRFDRLVAVHAILEGWGADEDTCLAGLLHAAHLAPELFREGDRVSVGALIGDRAARIVDAFSRIERSGALDAPQGQAGVDALADGDVPAFPDVTPDALSAAVAIHLARSADRMGTAHSSPKPWFAWAARWSRLARPAAPFLASFSEASLASSERELLSAYEALLEAPLSAERRARMTTATDAMCQVGEPHILLALGSLVLGQPQEALAQAQEGRRRLVALGTAWDARLPATSWIAIAAFVEQVESAPANLTAFFAGAVREALQRNTTPEQLFVRLSALELLPTPTADATPEPDDGEDSPFSEGDDKLIPDRFAEFLDGLLDDEPHRALGFYPGLRDQPWWDPEQFATVQALEASAAEIAAEFAALDPRTFHRESERIYRGGAWDVFLLYERGKKREDRCALVPLTSSIIESHSTLRTQAGLVYFSRLAPGSVVTPHRGPTNMRLRCHLGIKIPPDCHISVDNDTRTWTEGRCIVFDDSFTHSVWNSSDEERIVLIVDLWHPDLDEEEVALLSGLHKYGTLIGESLQKYWRKNDEAALVAAG